MSGDEIFCVAWLAAVAALFVFYVRIDCGC